MDSSERDANGADAPVKRAGQGVGLRRGLALSLGTFALMILVAEVGLRLGQQRMRSFEAGANRTDRRWSALVQSGFFESVSDLERRYAARPGARTEVDEWSFRANSLRARGPELSAPKPAHERRLLVLGDSFCFGMWSHEEETVAGHVERMANAAEEERGSGITWRAVNLGVPGYHLGQQVRAFEVEGLASDPDVVLLYFNTNDIVDDGFFYDDELRLVRVDPMPLPASWRRALWRSHLYGFVSRAVERHRTRGPKPHLDPNSPWSHTRPANQRYTAEVLARLVRQCRERELPLFAIHQPLMTWMGDARNPAWDLLPVVDWMEEQFEAQAVARINLLGWMRGYSDGVDRLAPDGSGPPAEFLLEQYFADETVQAFFRGELELDPDGPEVALPADPDFHLTGEGYGEIARLVYARMRAEGMLP